MNSLPLLFVLVIPLFLGTTAHAQVQTDMTADPNVALDMLEEMDQHSIPIARFVMECTQQASETADPNILEECTLVIGEFNMAMRDIWALHEPTIEKYVGETWNSTGGIGGFGAFTGQEVNQSQPQPQLPPDQPFTQQETPDPPIPPPDIGMEPLPNETGTETTTELQPAANEGVLTVDVYGSNNASQYYVCGGPMVTIREWCMSMSGVELVEEYAEFLYPLRDNNTIFACAIDQQDTTQYACDSTVSYEYEPAETITLTLRDESPIPMPFDVSEIQVVEDEDTETATNTNTTATEPVIAD